MKKEKDMNKKMNSEAQLTTFEAISMIVGNSIGTGIIAVPYLAVRNSMWDVVWMVAFAYIVNVILHLIIAELSYNNGGVQLVKSFEGELFHGKMKKIFSWIMFVVYGLAIMVGVSGNINGGAQIFVRTSAVGGTAYLLSHSRQCCVYGNESGGNCTEIFGGSFTGHRGGDDRGNIPASAEHPVYGPFSYQ